MEKALSKLDMKRRVSKEAELNLMQKLEALGVNIAFVKFLAAYFSELKFDSLDSLSYEVFQCDPDEQKRLEKSNWQKMYRRTKKQWGEHWRDKWNETKKQLQDSKREKYVLTFDGSFRPIPTLRRKGDQIKAHRLKHEGELTLIWVLKTYLERFAPEKSPWGLIAEMMNTISAKDRSASNLNSWWNKRKGDFEIWDEEVYLDSLLKFYENWKDPKPDLNEPGLDGQSKRWLGKHIERLKRSEKSDESQRIFQKEVQSLGEFSEE